MIFLAVVLLPWAVNRVTAGNRRIVIHPPVLAASGSSDPAQTDATPSPTADRGPALRLLLWNIAHGRGLSDDNHTGESLAERMDRHDAIAAVIRDKRPDIVILNEVDFDVPWSHGVDHAHVLADATGLPHRATQTNFDVQIVHQTYRWGNAVLSRWPITAARDVPIPGFATWESLLAGQKRAALHELDTPDGPLMLLATHLSPQSEALRARSAEALVEFDAPAPFILAGDLNAAAPGSPGAQITDDGRNAIRVLQASGSFTIPPDPPATYPARSPTRTIDWILPPAGWSIESTEAFDTTLSDHLPVLMLCRPPGPVDEAPHSTDGLVGSGSTADNRDDADDADNTDNADTSPPPNGSPP
ncbi:MAG: endonuclease/exonuclease/phosphatase family protein [Phycisphaerales bacterium]